MACLVWSSCGTAGQRADQQQKQQNTPAHCTVVFAPTVMTLLSFCFSSKSDHRRDSNQPILSSDLDQVTKEDSKQSS